MSSLHKLAAYPSVSPFDLGGEAPCPGGSYANTRAHLSSSDVNACRNVRCESPSAGWNHTSNAARAEPAVQRTTPACVCTSGIGGTPLP
jgi:hypothetical protein